MNTNVVEQEHNLLIMESKADMRKLLEAASLYNPDLLVVKSFTDVQELSARRRFKRIILAINSDEASLDISGFREVLSKETELIVVCSSTFVQRKMSYIPDVLYKDSLLNMATGRS